MVRRFLLTAILAALAVAMPAAAEDDPTASDPPLDPPAECPVMDLACSMPVCDASTEYCGLMETATAMPTATACRAWTVDPWANPTSTVVLDPEGCLRAYIRRALGWPPADTTAQVATSATSAVQDLLPW